MNDIRLNDLLAEMQRLAAGAATPAHQSGTTEAPGGVDFAGLLKASIQGVNEAQGAAAGMAAAFERGEADVSLPEVMIALQKASLSFQAMTEVRNRLVSAYQEIMSMPI
jgi:flagellar hook-basal body complex protein FliE